MGRTQQKLPIAAISATLNPVAEAAIPTAEPAKDTGESAATTCRQDLLILLVLLLAAFSFRLYSLQFFHVIANDGTSYALTARAIANGDMSGIGAFGFYPVCIAIATMVFSDLETAGRMTSVFFGSLLMAPLYYMGKELFSRKVAIAACLIAIVSASFVNYSCEVVTQATYTTLQLAAVFAIWQAFARPTIVRGSLAGFLIGITYLTRPEAILLSIVIPAALAAFNIGQLRKKLVFFWSYGASFLLLFTLNMLLVHAVTGTWQISAKTDAALNDALSYYLNIPDINYIRGYVPKTYFDIIFDYPEFLWKNPLNNLRQTWQMMLPLPLWLLFIIGVVAGFTRERIKRTVFLLATFAPLAVIIIFYYVVGGYTEAYMPVMLLFVAAGAASVEERLKVFASRAMPVPGARLLHKSPLLLIAAALYALTLLAPQLRANISDAEYRPEMDEGRRDEKLVGKMLKENLPAGKIMTRWARIAFYAEREWANVPAGVDYAGIIKTARDDNVRYLVASLPLLRMRPELGTELFAPLVDKMIPPGLFFYHDPPPVKGLRPVLINKTPYTGIIVYEIPR